MTSIRKGSSGARGPQKAASAEGTAPSRTEAPAASGTAGAGAEATGILAIGDKFTSAARPPDAHGKAPAGSPARPRRPLKGSETEFRNLQQFKNELQLAKKAKAARRGKVHAAEDSTAQEETRKLPFPSDDGQEPSHEAPPREKGRDHERQESPFAAADETADLEAARERSAPGPFPEKAGDLKRLFKQLSRKSARELEELRSLLLQVRDGPSVDRAAALTRLASEIPSPLKKSLGRLGIESEEIDRILDLPGFLKHSATLTSAEESTLERIGAALGLANGLKRLLPRGELPDYLEKAAPGLQVARDILRNGTALGDGARSEAERLASAVDLINDVQDLIPRDKLAKFLDRFAARLPLARDLTALFGTLLEEGIGAEDKAKAVIGFARAAEETVGQDWPRLAEKLAGLRSPGEIVRSALVLIDPDCSLQRKAESALRIWTGDGAPPSMSVLRDGLQRLLVSHPAEIAYTAASLHGGGAEKPASRRKRKAEPQPPAKQKLAPEAQTTLQQGAPQVDAQLDAQMNRLLQNVDHFNQVQNLLKSLERLDPGDPADGATRKAMIGGLSGMQEAALRCVLADTLDGKPVVSLLAEMMQKLPTKESKAAAADLLHDLDAGAVRLFLKLSSQLSIEVLGQLFRGQETPSGINAIGDAINTLADVLRNPAKAGKSGPEISRQAVEGLQKLAEAAGEVGVRARKTLEGVVQDFKLSGERGLEQLSEMALGTGLAASDAHAALAALAAEGTLSEDPGRRELAARALGALNEAAKENAGARQELDRALGAIGQQGDSSLETLRGLAQTAGAVGESAQREILSLVLKGGAAAENAYHLLVGLEETGVEALGKLRRYALRHGEKAIDVLDWIARHPGKAGESAMRDAVHSLQDIAEVEERVGRMAVAKLVALADENVPASDAAVEALVGILQSGPVNAGEVIVAWNGAETPGSLRVLDTLVLRGAAGADGLRHLAEGGGELGEHAQMLVGDEFDGVLDVLGSWSIEGIPED